MTLCGGVDNQRRAFEGEGGPIEREFDGKALSLSEIERSWRAKKHCYMTYPERGLHTPCFAIRD